MKNEGFSKVLQSNGPQAEQNMFFLEEAVKRVGEPTSAIRTFFKSHLRSNTALQFGLPGTSQDVLMNLNFTETAMHFENCIGHTYIKNNGLGLHEMQI